MNEPTTPPLPVEPPFDTTSTIPDQSVQELAPETLPSESAPAPEKTITTGPTAAQLLALYKALNPGHGSKHRGRFPGAFGGVSKRVRKARALKVVETKTTEVAPETQPLSVPTTSSPSGSETHQDSP